MATLSVFYVVRNEEAFIGQSIESVLALADEIVVVDTGSVDKTLSICARLGPKVVLRSFPWVDDFSAARNFAVRQCKKDWILYLDADERLEARTLGAISSFINGAGTNVMGLALPIRDHVGSWEAEARDYAFFPSPQVRLFRNDARIKFVGRCMETVGPSIEAAKGQVDIADLPVHHLLWKGKNEEYADGKVRYYQKLGANLPIPSGIEVGAPREREIVADPKDVAIVMCTWNGLHFTKSAVSSIQGSTNVPYRFFFVDQGSIDGTPDYLGSIVGATLLRLPENQGEAKGRNIGAKEALASPGTKYVCFVDNDIVVSNGWLSKMVSIMESNPQIGILGPHTRAELLEGKLAPDIKKYLMRGTLEQVNNDFGGRNEVSVPGTLSGACMLVSVNLIKSIGLFEESFGIFGYEALDYCMRSSKAGFSVARAEKVVIDHHVRSTLKINRRDWHSILLASKARFEQKWAPPPPKVLPVPIGDHLPRHVGEHLGQSVVSPSKVLPRTSIVIIAHNRLDMTRDCLESINIHSGPGDYLTNNHELVFVDNASTDGTGDYVRSRFPKATYIRNQSNTGVPFARNQGIRASKNDYIVMMDNDCVVAPGWLADLHAQLAAGADIAGIEAWQIDSSWATTRKCMSPGESFSYLGGACCIFRRSVFEEVGLLDEGFSPAYEEDSLSGDRCVPVRIDGKVDVLPLSELFEMGIVLQRSDGKEVSLLPNVETLAVDPNRPCPELDLDNLPDWWSNRLLSPREREIYWSFKTKLGEEGLDCIRPSVTPMFKVYGTSGEALNNEFCDADPDWREWIDVVKPRIKKRIKRSLREEANASWVPLKNVTRHKTDKEMVRVVTKFGQTRCTKDHSLMAWKDDKVVETKPCDAAGKNLCSITVPVELSQERKVDLPIKGGIFEGDILVFGNPKGERYSCPTRLKEGEERSLELARFMGYFVSEGSFSGTNIQISVCSKSLIEQMAHTASIAFGREISYAEYEDHGKERCIRGKKFKMKSDKYYRIVIGNMHITEMFAGLCGDGCRSKRVPWVIFDSSEDIKKAFLDGLFEGDAYRYNRNRSNFEDRLSEEFKRDAFKFSTSSLRLASGLCLLLSGLDMRFSTGFDEKKGEYRVNYVQFRRDKSQRKFGLAAANISDYVYDMAVDKYHTFVDAMGMLVVHNTDLCLRAKAAGKKLAWIPTPKIKHREHATLIGGQKDFNYRNALGASYQRLLAKMKGEIKVTHELLPKKDKKLRILYCAMYYDYGVREHGTSYEQDNFFPSLQQWDHTGAFKHFDYVALGQQFGVAKMSDMLMETVYEFKPDAVFSVYFDEHHDPKRSVYRRISEMTPAKTVGWFCDSHYRYDSFDSHWAPYLDYCVTTSEVSLLKYQRDGFSQKAIKSQWAAAPTYKKLDGVPRDVPISFVGQPHGDRRNMIAGLNTAGIQVRVFGTGWGQRLSFDEMIRMFNRSKVNLNLSNASMGSVQQIKGRNFEVPACGGFLMSGNVENLNDYYTIGKEVVTYQGEKDLADKIRYYLAHDAEREAIAQAGYERTMREHTYAHRFDAIFSRMNLL